MIQKIFVNYFLKKIISIKDFLIASFIVILITFSSNISAYLFQIFAGRNIDQGLYGEFNTLNSLSTLIIAPLTLLPLIIVNHFNSNNEYKLKIISSHLLQVISYISLLILIIFVFFIPFIENILQVNKINLIQVVIISILTLYNFLLLGIIQQKKKYITFAILGSLVIFLKLFFILIFLENLSVTLLLSSTLLGIFIVLVLNIYFTWNDIFLVKINKDDFISLSKKLFYNSYTLLLVNVSIIGFTNLDIIFVKLFFTSYDTGVYSASQIIAKIVFFFNSMFIITMFPEISANKENSDVNKNIFISIIVLTFISSFSFLLFIYIFGSYFFIYSYGLSYYNFEWLILVCICMTCLSLINLLNSYLISSHNSKGCEKIIYLIFIYILLNIFYHDTVNNLIYNYLLTMFIGIIYFIYLSLKALSIKRLN